MHRLRVQGLVRTADRVRRELAILLSHGRKETLARMVSEAICQVDRLVADHQTTVRALPSPSRRAYEFLRGLDFRQIESTAVESEGARLRESVSFGGLAAQWERILNALADPNAPSRADRQHGSIANSSRNIERQIEAAGLRVCELTPRTRLARGWLAYFSQRENFDAYLAAVACARPIFEGLLQAHARFKPPVILHFRPLRALYQVRGYRDGSRVVLPTPMIALAAEMFEAVAGMAFNNVRARQEIIEATLSDDCQEIQAEVDALGGVEEQVVGISHDLAASFERMNRRYFDNALARPRLTWSRMFTGRKFGHYDRVRGVVMISSTLDRPEVPDYVVDSVMHHELLHQQLGVGWSNGRMLAHTAAFRKAERQFERYAEAEAFLKRLAGVP